MTSNENNGNSNPSVTPIGSHQSPMMIDEENTTPCSTPLDRTEDAQAQPNEITEEQGRFKLVVWNHFKKRKVDGNDKAEFHYCMRLFVGGGGLEMALDICMTTKKYVLGKSLRTLGI